MDYDFESIKAEWIEKEREGASLMDSLGNILTRFKEGHKTHGDRVDRLMESLQKVSDRKRETIRALNSVVKKIDKLEKESLKGKQELRLLKIAENVANSKYEEILAGRLPTQKEPANDTTPESDKTEESSDLAERKRKFLENVTNAFDELDVKISEFKKRRAELVERSGSNIRNMKACQLSRGVLARKLEMYKAEINEHEDKLQAAIESEKDLLGEYHEFVERLKNVVDIPGSVETILSQTEAGLEPARNAAVSG